MRSSGSSSRTRAGRARSSGSGSASSGGSVDLLILLRQYMGHDTTPHVVRPAKAGDVPMVFVGARLWDRADPPGDDAPPRRPLVSPMALAQRVRGQRGRSPDA